MNIEKLPASPYTRNFNVFQKIWWNYKVLGTFDVWDLFPRGWKYFYYNKISHILDPQNVRYRKVIPTKWNDVSSLIEKVNFEFVKGFYEDEYKNGSTNWNATEQHQKFADWLESAYNYITIERPKLEKDLDKAYPPLRPLDKIFKPVKGSNSFELIPREEPYEIAYAEVNRIEKLIEDKDTEVLQNIISNRGYFWS